MAKAIGPSMDSTIRKNVLSVSISRAAAANNSSNTSRIKSRTSFLKLYMLLSTYMPPIVAMSFALHPSSSICLSNSSLLTR